MFFRCSHCLQTRAAYSRFRGIEWLLLLIGLRPFRCTTCYQRFYGFALFQTAEPSLRSSGSTETATIKPSSETITNI